MTSLSPFMINFENDAETLQDLTSPPMNRLLISLSQAMLSPFHNDALASEIQKEVMHVLEVLPVPIGQTAEMNA